MNENPFASKENPFASRENPYASPALPSDPVAAAVVDPSSKALASQGKRFINYLIDSVVLQVLGAMSGFMIGAVYGASKVAANQRITPDDQFQMQVAGFFIGLIVSICYFTFLECVFNRTIGKFLTGTMVVRADGGPPTFGQILGRSFARLIPFEPFSFFSGSYPVGWHDSLSGTRVVSIK